MHHSTRQLSDRLKESQNPQQFEMKSQQYSDIKHKGITLQTLTLTRSCISDALKNQSSLISTSSMISYNNKRE